MGQNKAHRAADMINKLFIAHVQDEPADIDLNEVMAVRDDIRELAYELEEEPDFSFKAHEFSVGDFGIDDNGPTPSPELNTVEVVELTATRADNFETDEGRLVSEYENNRLYPNDSLVVGVKFPNLSGDKTYHMPEARIRNA